MRVEYQRVLAAYSHGAAGKEAAEQALLNLSDLSK